MYPYCYDRPAPRPMRYDDRLATVLRLTPSGGNVARIQMRQLLDLLGTSPAEARSDVLDAAYLRMAELASHIPAADRAAMLGQPGLRLRSPRLVATLAHEAPTVAQAALAAAALAEDEWLDLIPALPIAARALVYDNPQLPPSAQDLLARLGIGDRGLPAPATPLAEPVEQAAEAPIAPTAPPEPEIAPPSQAGIGAIVRRIEAFRRSREEAGPLPPTTGDAPLLPLGEEHFHAPARRIEQFDFISDSEGRIGWCDAHVAPMIVGTHIAGRADMTTAWRQHQPMRGLRLELSGAPAVSGAWQVDAEPRFDPASGGFVGYIGRFRRPMESAAPSALAETDNEAERLRQLLHELRTPVNAIQGFAEIIQQQLFGPAPHEYRALAANIAGDAARLLAGFEELERYARLNSGIIELAAGQCDLAALVSATIARLAPHSEARQCGFRWTAPSSAMIVPLAPAEGERLCWRLLAVLAGMAQTGEVLEVTIDRQAGEVVLAMQLPAAQAGIDEAALFHAAASPAADAPQAGMFGTGFTLRLARAEAKSAGGRLDMHNAMVILGLPDLTETLTNHSDSAPKMKAAATTPVV